MGDPLTRDELLALPEAKRAVAYQRSIHLRDAEKCCAICRHYEDDGGDDSGGGACREPHNQAAAAIPYGWYSYVCDYNVCDLFEERPT